MKFPAPLRHLFAVLALAAVLPAMAVSSPTRPLPPHADDGIARVIVKFKAGAATLHEHALPGGRASRSAVRSVLAARAAALGQRHGVLLDAGRALSEHMQVVTTAGLDSAALARTLAADGDVEFAEPDRRRTRQALPNDPLFAPVAGASPASGQWYLKAPSGDVVSSIDAPAAWALLTDSPVVVAVVDTGVRFDHPDLQAQLLPGYDMVRDATISNDGDGRDADAADPGDWVTAGEAATSTFSACDAADSSWHGTEVSGLIGATGNNGIGMTGVAWNVKLLPVRVLGKCFGWDSDIIAGMRWAAGLSVSGVPANPHPARVINLSLGGGTTCTSSYSSAVSEITAAGALVVAAAGNGSGHAVVTPANCPGVLAVAGLRHAGTKVGYSNVGAAVGIAAPAGNCVTEFGECQYPMLSTTNRGTTVPISGAAGASYSDGYHPAVGTSFSTPLVSGTAALMLAANPQLTPSRLVELIKGSARAFPASGGSPGTPACHAPDGSDQVECYCTTATCGAGMLDTGAAVLAARATSPSATDAGLQAVIGATPSSPAAGQAVTFSAAGTRLESGRAIVAYAWTVVDGGGIVSGFSGAADGSSATAMPSGPGRFTVGLTVTDDLGKPSSAQLTLTVSASASAQASTSTGNGGNTGAGTDASSAGGGALSWPWLLGLAASVALLAGARAAASRHGTAHRRTPTLEGDR